MMLNSTRPELQKGLIGRLFGNESRAEGFGVGRAVELFGGVLHERGCLFQEAFEAASVSVSASVAACSIAES